jgi:pimeloyl-ACP methyl ester carboxylesterase
MPTLESRWRVARGYRIHVREGGVGDPVVLVHGLGVSGDYLEPLGRELARSFRVSIPDLPGWGESAKPERALGLQELAEVLAGLAGPYEPPPSFVANSLGCQVALALAERYPGRARALALVGPTVDPAYRGLLHHALRLLIGATREHSGIWPIVLRDYFQMGPRRILTTARAALADEPERRLPRIQAPVLVLRGERDALTTVPGRGGAPRSRRGERSSRSRAPRTRRTCHTPSASPSSSSGFSRKATIASARSSGASTIGT